MEPQAILVVIYNHINACYTLFSLHKISIQINYVEYLYHTSGTPRKMQRKTLAKNKNVSSNQFNNKCMYK